MRSRFSSTALAFIYKCNPLVYFWNAIKTLVLFLARAGEKKKSTQRHFAGTLRPKYSMCIKSPTCLPSLFLHHCFRSNITEIGGRGGGAAEVIIDRFPVCPIAQPCSQIHNYIESAALPVASPASLCLSCSLYQVDLK